MRPTLLSLLLVLPGLASAGADGDGFTVQDGDCDDYDPFTYPGAPELCDGIDNDCGEVGVISTLLLPLGNGNDGEGLAYRSTDGLWYHTSGISNGSEFFETVDINTFAVGPNLAGGTYGPDPVGEIFGIVWYDPLGVFIVFDSGGDMFHATPTGNFTNIYSAGGGGGSGWAPTPSNRGLAVVGSEIFAVDNNNQEMRVYDPATGTLIRTMTVTIDGALGQGCNGIATHPTTGQLWAICKDVTGGYYATYGSRLLVEIDPLTGIGYNRGDTGQKLSGIDIDDAGRILAVAGDGNFLGIPEAIYELELTGGGGPQPGEFDLDGDGFLACEGDCDDNDQTNAPGRPEACDGLDNDCDGAPGADEVDLDGDGFMVCAGDCDDTNPAVYRNATEVCDGLDTDCNGELPMAEQDADLDGFPWCDDCDDNDPGRNPGAAEVCDGLDNDCSGALEADESDADGDGFLACNDDCDDFDPGASPLGTEIAGDGIDQDCDGQDLAAGGPGDTADGKGGGGGCGCTTGPGPAGLALWALPLALIGLRRRE